MFDRRSSSFCKFLRVDWLLCVCVAASPPGAAQCRTLKGETPLFLAVLHGFRENATFMLQNGCNPDIQNDEQDSPLVAGIKVSLKARLFQFYFTVCTFQVFSLLFNSQLF